MSRLSTRAARALISTVAAASVTIAIPAAAQAAFNPKPVGSSPKQAVPTVQAERSVAGTRSVAAVSCNPANGFTRIESGSLYRLLDPTPDTGVNTLTEQGIIGSGWGGSGLAWIASGGDGVVYALTWGGQLRWYRYNYTTRAWYTGSGKIIGSGFTPRTRIINIAFGGTGDFYVVRANGTLAIYRHTDRLNGGATWANPIGYTIGSGWTGREILVPNGDGTLYRQYAGLLYWYRHTDPQAGRVTWSARRSIGSGWKFYDIVPAGGGVLYATNGGDGRVYKYRHNYPTLGYVGWASSTGVSKYTARADSYGIALDPIACTYTP